MLIKGECEGFGILMKTVELKPEAFSIDTLRERFDARSITSRRFLYNPNTNELILGDTRYADSPQIEYCRVKSTNEGFDNCIRGQINQSDKEYLIEFSSPYSKQQDTMPEDFGYYHRLLEMFVANGLVPKNTIVAKSTGTGIRLDTILKDKKHKAH